jgi:hypothetical protein
LSKLSEAKNHISVKVEMDEMDVSAAESKATYQEIQGWVQDKYGFHVTNLNIAQVKRKHGIIERENYNKAKSPDTRQLGCPEEKERAIDFVWLFCAIRPESGRRACTSEHSTANVHRSGCAARCVILEMIKK